MFKRTTRLSALLLALVMVLSVVMAVPSRAYAADKAFEDVGESHALFDYVKRVEDRKFYEGDNAGNFNAEDPMTRAQVAKVLVRAKGIEVDEEDRPTEKPFKDVAADHQLAAYILAAKNATIFLGDADGNFNPEGNITRGQAAAVVVRTLGFEMIEDDAVEFTDVPADHTFANEIAILASQGIVTGFQGKFDPELNVTRAQFAKYLVNGVTFLEADEAVAALKAVLANEDATQEMIDAAYAKAVEAKNALLEDEKKEKVTDAIDELLPVVVVVSISAINDITVTVGDNVVLPTEVEVTYNDDSKAKVAVEWNVDEFDFAKVGTYALTGTIEDTDLTAAVNVEVISKLEAAERAVVAYEDSLLDADKDDAVAAIDALEVPEDATNAQKRALEARVDDVDDIVADIVEEVNDANTLERLEAALSNDAFKNVNNDYIEDYDTHLGTVYTTVDEIQAVIDNVNDWHAAQAFVKEVKALKYDITSIQTLNTKDLAEAKAEQADARATYEDLSDNAKKDTDVVSMVAELAAREDAVESRELALAQADAEKARTRYEAAIDAYTTLGGLETDDVYVAATEARTAIGKDYNNVEKLPAATEALNDAVAALEAATEPLEAQALLDAQAALDELEVAKLAFTDAGLSETHDEYVAATADGNNLKAALEAEEQDILSINAMTGYVENRIETLNGITAWKLVDTAKTEKTQVAVDAAQDAIDLLTGSTDIDADDYNEIKYNLQADLDNLLKDIETSITNFVGYVNGRATVAEIEAMPMQDLATEATNLGQVRTAYTVLSAVAKADDRVVVAEADLAAREAAMKTAQEAAAMVNELVIRDAGGTTSPHWSVSLDMSVVQIIELDSLTISLYDGETKIGEQAATDKTLTEIRQTNLSSPFYLDPSTEDDYWAKNMTLLAGTPDKVVINFVVDGVDYQVISTATQIDGF